MRAAVFAVVLILASVAWPAAAAPASGPSTVTVPSSGSFMYVNTNGFGWEWRELLILAGPGQFVGGGLRMDRFGGFARAINERWQLDLRTPAGAAMTVGSYDSETGAQLTLFGNSAGCQSGRFSVTELSFSSLGEITVFDSSFETACGASGRLRIESPAPAPGATLPPGTTTVPTTGTFLYLIKTNTIAGIDELLFTTADSWFDVRLSAEEMRAWVERFDRTHWWGLDLESTIGRALSVGRYDDALSPESHNAVQPGMRSGGDGQGCNEVHGSFTVDHLSRAASGELRVFEATFHYYCDISVVLQHGRLRYENLALPPAPAPVVDLTLKEDASVDIKTGAATISGTVSCDRSVPVTVSGIVDQVTNKTDEHVRFTTTLACVAPQTRWSYVVRDGVLRPGDARGTATVAWCEESCVTSSLTRGLKLNSGNSQ